MPPPVIADEGLVRRMGHQSPLRYPWCLNHLSPALRRSSPEDRPSTPPTQVDDDLIVLINGVPVFEDHDVTTNIMPPIAFQTATAISWP